MRIPHSTPLAWLGVLAWLFSGVFPVAANLPALENAPAIRSANLGSFLEADGSLRIPAGFNGALDAEGWQLSLDPSGAPRFTPAQAAFSGWDPDFSPRGTSWPVKALAVDGDSVYVGGGFVAAGDVMAPYVARWDTSSGAWSALGEFYEGVEALLFNGGYLYAGGESFLSRWDPLAETWTDLGHPIGTVRAIAALGDYIYIGGSFSEVDGVSASELARFHLPSQAWEAVGSGVDQVVYALAAGGGQLYLGGEFEHAGSLEAGKIASWNPATGDWSTLNGGLNGGDVHALAYHAGSLYAGGWITETGGVSVTHVARWDGAQWAAMGDNLSGTVYGLDASDQGIFATTTLAYDPDDPDMFKMGVQWNPGSGAWEHLGGGLECLTHASQCETYTVASGGGQVYFGGDFNRAGEQTALHVAAHDLSAGTWAPFYDGPYGLGVDNEILAIAVKGSDVYIGGWFQQVGNLPARHLARWDSLTHTWHALGEGVDWGVYALAVMGDDLYVGGRFGEAGGVEVSYLARWDTYAGTWHAVGSGANPGPDDWVEALAVDGDRLYVGGYFTSIRDVGQTDHIAVWDAGDQSWTLAPETGMGWTVLSILPLGEDVYAGGMFYQNAGSDYAHIARWHLPTNTWHAVGAGLDGNVHVLAPYEDTLLAGGVFPGGVRRWDSASQTWQTLPGGWVFGGYFGIVYDIAVAPSGDLFVVGNFTQAGWVQAYGIAQYSAACDLWMPVANGFNNRALAAALMGDQLYAGGSFSLAGTQPAFRLASRAAGTGTCLHLPLIVQDPASPWHSFP